MRVIRLTTSVLSIAALALSGCAGTNDASPGQATDVVRLGLLPIVDVAPIYLGQEQGFFEDEGIALEISVSRGGAAVVPAVVGGSVDIGFGNNTSTLIGASEGLPVEVIASGVYSTGDPNNDYVQLIAAPHGSVTSPADLEGRTVAVNTLRHFGDTAIRESVTKAGGNPDLVEFVEMPFPDMAPALESGQIDAAWQVEPFIEISNQNHGHIFLSSPVVDVSSDLMISSYFSTSDFVKNNPELVERFKSAVDRSLEYAEANPEEVRDNLDEYFEISPEVAEKLVLPKWDTAIDRETFEIFIDIGIEGQSLENVDLDEFLP